jgi:hypothetical protein
VGNDRRGGRPALACLNPGCLGGRRPCAGTNQRLCQAGQLRRNDLDLPGGAATAPHAEYDRSRHPRRGEPGAAECSGGDIGCDARGGKDRPSVPGEHQLLLQGHRDELEWERQRKRDNSNPKPHGRRAATRRRRLPILRRHRRMGRPARRPGRHLRPPHPRPTRDQPGRSTGFLPLLQRPPVQQGQRRRLVPTPTDRHRAGPPSAASSYAAHPASTHADTAPRSHVDPPAATPRISRQRTPEAAAEHGPAHPHPHLQPSIITRRLQATHHNDLTKSYWYSSPGSLCRRMTIG